MSAICTLCKTNWCGCGGGAVCSSCKKKLKDIENNPNLSQEEKNKKIAELNVNNNKTQ